MRLLNEEFIWDSSDTSHNGKERCYANCEAFELSFDEIQNGIVLVVETICDVDATRYENAVKQSISNRVITDMSYDPISDDSQV